MSVSPAVIVLIDDLQNRYIRALDSKDMAAWLATFSPRADASYICTTAENDAAGLPLSLVFDDCHARLEDRVSFVTKVWVGTFQDYRTRHFVQRTACSALKGGEVEVESNFSLMYTPCDTGRTELFTAGVYLDRIAIDGDRALFLSKKVITDSAIMARYVAFPL